MTSTSRRASALLAGCSIAAVAALGVGAVAASGASATDLTPTSTSGTGDVDPRLAEDRESARGLEGQERRAAVKKIRQAVEAGSYGDEAKQRLEKRQKRAERLRSQLPSELRQDLTALKGASEEEKKAARAKIRERALDGGYGKALERYTRVVG